MAVPGDSQAGDTNSFRFLKPGRSSAISEKPQSCSVLIMSGFLGETSTTENCNISFLILACEFAALFCDIFCLYSLPCMGMGSNSLNNHHETHTHIRWISVCQSIAVLGAMSLLRWNISPSNFQSNSTKQNKFCPWFLSSYSTEVNWGYNFLTSLISLCYLRSPGVTL